MSSSILELLTSQLGGDSLKKISQSIGADEGRTQAGIAAALPTILGALARNASNRDGAESLNRALEKDHDGGLLGNLAGFLGQGDASPGQAILKHVLGSRQSRVEAGLGKASGLDSASMGKLLATLAPVVMGALGQQKRQSGLDASGIAGLLGKEREAVERKAPQEMGLLGGLLDADGDGDVDMDDIAKKGMGMLGKLLGGR